MELGINTGIGGKGKTVVVTSIDIWSVLNLNWYYRNISISKCLRWTRCEFQPSWAGLCRAESKVRQGSKWNKRKKLFCFLLLEEKILKCFNFANGNQLELDGESSSMSFAFVVVGLGKPCFVFACHNLNFGSRRWSKAIDEREPWTNDLSDVGVFALLCVWHDNNYKKEYCELALFYAPKHQRNMMRWIFHGISNIGIDREKNAECTKTE